MTFDTSDHQQNNLTEKLIKFVAQLQDQIARQQEQFTEQEVLLTQQHDQIVQLKEQNVQQQEYIEALKPEIVRLKKLSPKPNIKLNTKPSDDSSGSDSDNQPSADSGDNSPGKDDGPGNEKADTGKPNENTRHARKSPPKPPIDDEVNIPVPAEDLPPGFR